MKNRNHVLPLVAAPAALKGVTAVASVAKGAASLGSLVSKALPGLSDLGKITEGIVDKKLAAGIAAGHALGYSDQQLRQEPLYSIVAAIGQFPYTIKAVVNDPRPLFARIAGERGITLPSPDLNAFPYSPDMVCGPGTTWCSKIPDLIERVFGKGVADLSRARAPITSLPPASAPGFTEPVSARIQDETQKRTQETPAGGASLELLKPLIPVMDAGLLDAGIVPPKPLEEKALTFYERIVVPEGGGSFGLDEDIVAAIISFVAAKAQKKLAGEEQAPIYDKIGEVTLEVQEKLEEKVRQEADRKVGGFITGNISTILLALAAVILLASFGKKR